MDTVVRNGKHQFVKGEDIVPGDLVLVKNGQNFPCDMVMIECHQMKINMAAITGDCENITMSS
jgi:Ca2+-transporting ATPase